jgi:hypothetical protein
MSRRELTFGVALYTVFLNPPCILLVSDLQARGLDKDVLVVMLGEFGKRAR